MTIKNTDLPELIVIFLFCIYSILKVLLDTTQLAMLINIDTSSFFRNFSLILIICLALNLLHLKMINIRKLYIGFLYLGLTLFVAYFSERETEIVLRSLFILNGIFLKDSKFLKVYLISITICVVLTVLFTVFGIYEMDALYENRGIRYFLGFTYTTFLPIYYLHLVIVYIALKKRYITSIETIIILFLNQLLFILTDTKAVYILILLSVFLLWIYRIFPYILTQKLFKIIAISTTGIMAFIAVFVSYIYNPGNYYLEKINKALAGRLLLGNKAIKEYGFTMFGTLTEWVTGRVGIERSGDYFWVDSSFLNALLSFGLITLLFFVICYMVLTKHSWDVKNYYLCFAIVLLSIHGLTDQQLFNITYSPILMLLGPTLFGTIKDIIKPDNW